MAHGVRLEEVILTAVARDLQLGSRAELDTFLSAHLQRSNNVLLVPRERHGPLVELARGQPSVPFTAQLLHSLHLLPDFVACDICTRDSFQIN